ncbi:hypothetical protein SAMN02745746_04076, partial [Pseudogulbenkiania subflava DSM 22618]
RFVFVEHWASPEAQHKHHTQGEHILHFHAGGIDAVEKAELFYNLSLVA